MKEFIINKIKKIFKRNKSKESGVDVKDDKKAIFLVQAQHFYFSYKCLNEQAKATLNEGLKSKNPAFLNQAVIQATYTLLPAYVLLYFSIELHLKYLFLINNPKVKRTHNLISIVNSLDNNLMKEIENKMSLKRKEIHTELQPFKNHFEELRYLGTVGRNINLISPFVEKFAETLSSVSLSKTKK